MTSNKKASAPATADLTKEVQMVKMPDGSERLIISLPNVYAEDISSKSGKTRRVCSTQGATVTSCMIDGEAVIVSVNAYTKR